MTIESIDGSQRRAARIAGVACLLSFAIVVAINFGVLGPITQGTDHAQVARNILAHETAFRMGIAGNLLYFVGVLALSGSLYVILRPVGANLALFAMLGRIIHGLSWFLMTLNLFTALRLLGNDELARAFAPGQLPALSRLYLSSYDQYYAGLFFWSLAATADAWLWFQSRWIPRALAVFGVAASAWCAACTFILFVVPEFPRIVNLWWFDSPMALFEIALSFVLLVRGLRPSGLALPGGASSASVPGAA